VEPEKRRNAVLEALRLVRELEDDVESDDDSCCPRKKKSDAAPAVDPAPAPVPAPKKTPEELAAEQAAERQRLQEEQEEQMAAPIPAPAPVPAATPVANKPRTVEPAVKSTQDCARAKKFMARRAPVEPEQPPTLSLSQQRALKDKARLEAHEAAEREARQNAAVQRVKEKALPDARRGERTATGADPKAPKQPKDISSCARRVATKGSVHQAEHTEELPAAVSPQSEPKPPNDLAQYARRGNDKFGSGPLSSKVETDQVT
jgi:hypothetical protein